MATSKNDLFYPVLPPNKDAVCDSSMTGGGLESVVKFILNKEQYYQLMRERSKNGFDLQQLKIPHLNDEISLDSLKSLIETYIAQYTACLVDGKNDFKIKLVLKQEWKEMINQLDLQDGVATDLRLFHIKEKKHNFFMLAKNVAFLLQSEGTAQSAAPFAVFFLHSIRPEVEKYAEIYFTSWSNFAKECREHDHVVRGHIFNCLVALSNGDHRYEDDEGYPYGLTDGSNWEIKDTTGYEKVYININSDCSFRKTKDKLCHVCIRGNSSDYRLVFWNQKYHSKHHSKPYPSGKAKAYVIVKIKQHSDEKMVKKKGHRHSKERRSRKRTASDDYPQALERELDKIKVVFYHEEQPTAE